MAKEFEITDSLIADYQAAWDHADRMPGREPGDRRRAGLAAVAPIIVAEVMAEMVRVGALGYGDIETIAYDAWGIEL